MRVFAKATLRKFWETPAYRDAEQTLKAWFEEASKAEWKTPNEVKEQFRSVSILPKGRLVFNIGGNKYRIIVAINYKYGRMYICFIGTHRQYDRVNAEEVWTI
jgi:mRNA interferase HigB